jgi:hypothetical protein
MQRVNAVVLWMLFGGGTVMAVGSILSSIKHSMAGGTVESGNDGSPPFDLPAGEISTSRPESKIRSEGSSESTLLGSPVPASLPAEFSEPARSSSLDTSRGGKKKKKPRREEPRKRVQEKSRRETRRAQREESPQRRNKRE